jgi:hypothetical protein
MSKIQTVSGFSVRLEPCRLYSRTDRLAGCHPALSAQRRAGSNFSQSSHDCTCVWGLALYPSGLGHGTYLLWASGSSSIKWEHSSPLRDACCHQHWHSAQCQAQREPQKKVLGEERGLAIWLGTDSGSATEGPGSQYSKNQLFCYFNHIPSKLKKNHCLLCQWDG